MGLESKGIWAVLIVIAATCLLFCTKFVDGKTQDKRGKVLSFFNVVEFPNDICIGNGNRNGTCYTEQECEDRNGVSSGSCASGYGVCCIIQLACGGTSSENCTYLVMAATAAPGLSCDFTVCPASNQICRMRFDFTTFDIAQPYKTTVDTTVAAGQRIGGSVGDCVDDTFDVAVQGNEGSPTICGFNTGQHLFVDMDGSAHCARPVFSFSGATVTRQFDIKVTQYDCGEEMGGPPGCLQFFTGNAGTVASFNFPTELKGFVSTGQGVDNPTHLSNQNYNMCFRRNDGKCAICFRPVVTQAIAGAISSYGLGVSQNTITTNSAVGTKCDKDYLIIPNAINNPAIAMKQNAAIAGDTDRVCGRIFDSAAGGGTLAAAAYGTQLSVCTGHRPFEIRFRTDSNEVQSSAAADNVETKTEANEFARGNPLGPAGIIGFNLNFKQFGCTTV